MPRRKEEIQGMYEESVTEDFWSRIAETEYPVVLYGTGDAADTVMRLLEERGVRVFGVFASDGFVRHRTFHSMRVLSYSEAKRIFGRMAVVMAFGTHSPSVIGNIKRIAAENEFYCPSLLSDENGKPFGMEYYRRHLADFSRFRSLLTDERSRNILDGIVSFRLTGDIDFLLPLGEEESRSWSELTFSDSETFVDVGAYDGDTIERFLSLCGGHYSRIIGFEPDRRSYLRALGRLGGREGITLYNTLLSSEGESVRFVKGEGRGNRRSDTGEERKAFTLDMMMGRIRPTIIKFDAEGDEEKILEGGRNVISSSGPRLILSVYHRIDDFWKLSDKVRQINPAYSKFTLRVSRSIPDWDIILIVE